MPPGGMGVQPCRRVGRVQKEIDVLLLENPITFADSGTRNAPNTTFEVRTQLSIQQSFTHPSAWVGVRVALAVP